MTLSGYRALRVVDGTGGPVLEDGVILFEGEHIVGIVAAGDTPAGTEVEDLGDVTILPGLVDAHVHMIWDGSHPQPELIRQSESVPKSAMRAARHALQTLMSGTTTVRDTGCPGGVSIALREAINEGLVSGPRMLVAGATLVMTGGHCHAMGVEVDSPYDARRAARQQLKEGADFIKILATGGVYGLRHDVPWSPQLTVEEMKAAADEARKAGRVAAIHAEGEEGIGNAIEAGADTIEHCNQLTPALARTMADRGIFLVPTLAWFFNVAEATPSAAFSEEYIRKGRIMAECSTRSLALARQAGVKIAAGTDAGAPLVPHNSVRREIELLVRLGFTPMEAIEAGTRVSAEAMRLEQSVGTLAPGKYADFIAVGGDPTRDVRALYDLRLVVKGGAVVVRRQAGPGFATSR